MSTYAYVDNSNLWIEGKRRSAVSRGLATDIGHAFDENKLDHDWRYDFGRLHELLFPSGAPGRAMLFGSRTDARTDAQAWEQAAYIGWECVTEDRNALNKEKMVDTGLVAAAVKDACLEMEDGDEMVLVTGDLDYLPVIRVCGELGIPVRVAFWSHANRDLREEAGSFLNLDPKLGFLERKAGRINRPQRPAPPQPGLSRDQLDELMAAARRPRATAA